MRVNRHKSEEVKKPASHAGNMGSNPIGITKNKKMDLGKKYKSIFYLSGAF